VSATLVDDANAGVYLATVTLTKTGVYTLEILLRGLEVPTQIT